jgi:hypothetical protein
LFKEFLEFCILGVILLDPPSCLVFRKEFISFDRSTLEDDIDTGGFELIDERLELPEKVEDDGRRAGLESRTCTVSLVHKIDT